MSTSAKNKPRFYGKRKGAELVILDIFARTVNLLLSAVSLAMLLRMLLSFFVFDEDSRLLNFLAVVTEPFIAPVRALLVRFNIGQDSPIDWSFSLTYLLIAIAQMFLPSL